MQGSRMGLVGEGLLAETAGKLLLANARRLLEGAAYGVAIHVSRVRLQHVFSYCNS